MDVTIILAVVVFFGTLGLMAFAYRTRLRMIGDLVESGHLDEVRAAVQDLQGPAREHPLSSKELLSEPTGSGRVPSRRTSRELLITYGVYEESPSWVHHVTMKWERGDIVAPAAEELLNTIRATLDEGGSWRDIDMVAGESPGIYHVIGKSTEDS